MHGDRNLTDGLWDVDLTQQSSKNKLNVIVQKTTTKNDLIAFYHGACFSPTKKTLLQAIRNGNFLTWPGFTYEAVSKFLQQTVATAFGHLH